MNAIATVEAFLDAPDSSLPDCARPLLRTRFAFDTTSREHAPARRAHLRVATPPS